MPGSTYGGRPIKSFETKQLEQAQHRAELAELQTKRRAELDVFAQQEAERQRLREEHEREHADFVARVQAWHESGKSADVSTIPTIEGLTRQALADEQAAKEEAERQRIANRTPREIWLSTLSFSERDHVRRWEQINHTDYPMPQTI